MLAQAISYHNKKLVSVPYEAESVVLNQVV